MSDESMGARDSRSDGWSSPQPDADGQAETVVGPAANQAAGAAPQPQQPQYPEPKPTKILPIPGQTVVQPGPQYNQPGPPYGQAGQQFGQPGQQFGQPGPPQYGQPAQQYGQPGPQYGQDPGQSQGYGQPQAQPQSPGQWAMPPTAQPTVQPGLQPTMPPAFPQPPQPAPQIASQSPYWQQDSTGPGQTPVPGQSAPLGYSGGYTLPPGQPASSAAWPPVAKHRFPMWMRIGIPVLVLALAGGTYGVIKLTSSPTPAVTKVQCKPEDLASCLVAAPGAATADTSSWAKATTVTSTEYAAQFADSAEAVEPEVNSLITADGVKAIVHKAWSFGSDQVDIILFRFGTIQGAQAWAHDRDGEFLSTDGGSPLTVTGDSSAKASTSASPNSSGDYIVHYMTTVGNIDLEVHYASQGSLQQQNFDQWASTEYASLQTAPAPPADPAPAPTVFQAATCPGGTLTNCLMPMPTGGVVLPGLPTTYTVNSWATSAYTTTAAPSIEQTLNADEVTTIDAEAFGTEGFNKASQVVLLQTRTEDQAKDLQTSLGGVTTTYPDSFSVPGFPDAEGSYTTVPASGTDVVDGWVDAQVGTVFLSMWFGFNSAFDTATAQSWAVTELTLLTQRTQSHWGFPIPTVTTPTLAPFAADPCTTDFSGCLMALPDGASASSGSTNPQDPGVSGLASALYPNRDNYEETWLTGDGSTDAASETWTAADGATATDYLLKFSSGRQAQAAALHELGDNLAGSQSCAVSTLPNTYCVVLPENDSTGAVTIRVIGWGPHYGFDLEVTQTDSADTKDALTWAQTQAELVSS